MAIFSMPEDIEDDALCVHGRIICSICSGEGPENAGSSLINRRISESESDTALPSEITPEPVPGARHLRFTITEPETPSTPFD